MGGDPFRLFGFRSRNAPASLKVASQIRPHPDPVTFPEQKCSGFIEGRSPTRPAHSSTPFPEQKCSGFIEGSHAACKPTHPDARFRSRNAPASLKGR